MKCISLWQPWATLCVIGAKTMETRSWPTSYRGMLLIHAAKKWDQDLMQTCLDEPFRSVLKASGLLKLGDVPRGCIIGAVELEDVYAVSRTGFAVNSGHREQHPAITRQENAFGDFSEGRFAWRLTKPRRFATPIPYRGMQQIFDVPDEVVDDQMKAVAA